MDPVERPSNPFDPSIRAFVTDRLVAGQTLVVTMRILWRSYLQFSRETGYDPVRADEFAEYFERDCRLSIVEGRTGRAVNGVGFKR